MIEKRQIHIKIEGLEPGYMQSRMDPRTFEDAKIKTGRNMKDPKMLEEAAFNAIYFNADQKPCIPSKHIRGSLIAAAKDFKAGRRSYRELFASAVFVTPELIPIVPPKWEIEHDIVRNASTGGRLPVARPRFPGGWTADFDLSVEDSQLTDETLKRIIDHAGLRKGIGSYNPPHEGPYGRYIVREFKSL
jgi:hypothetical protein